MDRRWTGLLIIIVVVLGAAIVPNVVGKQIAGVAHAAPIPGPPLVGDCLTVPETDSWIRNPHPSYRPQALAPCGAGRFGEVVAVIGDGRSHDPAAPTIQAPADGSDLGNDPNLLTCLDATWRYLGMTVGEDHASLISSYWSSLTFFGIAPSGPTDLQKAAGQAWVACVMFVGDRNGDSVSYPGTVRNTYSLGNEPAVLAVCLDSSNLGVAQSVPCDGPHTVEAFGSTETARAGLTQRSLDASCRALVLKLTRMADPSVGGQLAVKGAAVHFVNDAAVPGLGPPGDVGGYAACLVLAPKDHPLNGTLLALGTRPVPWAR